MDTIQIRINSKEKFRIMSWARLVPEFSVREFKDLSQAERLRRKDNRMPYLRHFKLHPEVTREIVVTKVDVYENANNDSGAVQYEMTILVSLPKHLYGNSLCELTPSDKETVFNAIAGRLSGAGIQVSSLTIATASVSVVHFCKNIILPANLSFRRLLTELSHIDIGKAYDTRDDARVKDKNNGEVLHFYSGSREWSFYNKIDDMKRPKNKSEDKIKTDYEKELVEFYRLQATEVFRYEYRLKSAQTIKSELNAIFGRPYQTPVLFNDLFMEGLWKSVLLRSWKRVIDSPENQLALLSTNSKLDLLIYILKSALKKDKSGHSQNQALWSYGLATAIKDHGAKAIRKELGKVWSSKADERMDEKLAIAAKLAEGIPFSDEIFHISKELKRFEPIDLALLEKGV